MFICTCMNCSQEFSADLLVLLAPLFDENENMQGEKYEMHSKKVSLITAGIIVAKER